MILHPKNYENEAMKLKAKHVFLLLQTKHYDKTMSFDSFLQDIAISEQEYITLLSGSISRPTILLKRHPMDTWINPFAKGVPELWLANTDA